ncbi:MAG: enoyl-CoA hydratase/isomerase family protein [Candidatus Acidulodesulfobacterium sp.]
MPVKFNCAKSCIAEIDLDLDGKNSFNIAGINELIKIFESNLEKEIDLKAVVIKSSNPDYFATGPEIKEIAGLDREGARYYVTLLNVLTKHISESAVPVVCIINGAVSGIGLDIVSSCDFRLAGEKASFADLSSKYGILYPSHIILRLSFLIGVQKTKEILLSSKIYTAEDMYRFNFLTGYFSGENFEKGVNLFIENFKNLSVDSLRLKKKLFIDLWKNYLKNNQLPSEEIFSEILKEGKDWKKSIKDFYGDSL